MNTGASRIVSALAFVAIIGVGCLLILLVGNTIPAVRRANRQPHLVEAAAGRRRRAGQRERQRQRRRTVGEGHRREGGPGAAGEDPRGPTRLVSSARFPMRVLYSFPDGLGAPGIGTTARHQVEGLLARDVEVSVWCTSLHCELPRARRVVTTLAGRAGSGCRTARSAGATAPTATTTCASRGRCAGSPASSTSSTSGRARRCTRPARRARSASARCARRRTRTPATRSTRSSASASCSASPRRPATATRSTRAGSATRRPSTRPPT